MVKFKSIKLNGPPNVGQLYRYWGCHQFVIVTAVLPNGTVKAAPYGRLRKGTFIPSKSPRQYTYTVHGMYLCSTMRGLQNRMPLRPGTLLVC